FAQDDNPFGPDEYPSARQCARFSRQNTEAFVRLLFMNGLAVGALAASPLAAQLRPIAVAALPAPAAALHQRFSAVLRPSAKAWVDSEAVKVGRGTTDGETAATMVRADAGRRFATLGASGTDIEAIAFIVLMQATNDMGKDLKALMADVEMANSKKQKMRDAHATLKSAQDSLKKKLDSMNDMTEMTSLRLQMAMDRRSKFMTALSNIMKKIDSTQSAIVQNLK
ncbi:MAG: hypothetical protein ABJD07_10210, partial [Gemmatimonadaceae bacterium]